MNIKIFVEDKDGNNLLSTQTKNNILKDSFEIHWGDGTTNKIRFTRNFKWTINGKYKITNSNIYLNDKKVEDKLIIVK